MNTLTIREKLYDYIRVADDKKIKALYMMLEDDVTEQAAWWKDKVLMAELDKRYDAWNAGKVKGYSLADIKSSIASLKKKRKVK